jgi:hypothetical protein
MAAVDMPASNILGIFAFRGIEGKRTCLPWQGLTGSNAISGHHGQDGKKP